MRMTDIQKPTVQEEELFLSAMIDTIMMYDQRLSELEERYERIRCSLITPCYFNFRDALFHYEKAYNSQEIIQLYCEQNTMLEHLHRALKDGCIRYLQLINERLNLLYRYECTSEHFRQLSNSAELIASRARVPLVEIHRIGENIIELNDYLPKSVTVEEYQLICEYLFNVRFGIPCTKKKLLQKVFHALRNLELDSRNSSMRIVKSFSVDIDQVSQRAPIDSFFESCDQQLSVIRDAGLEDFVIAAEILYPLPIQ